MSFGVMKSLRASVARGAFATVLACSLALAGSLPVRAQSDAAVDVGAPAPVAALWPIFVAQDQGFFEKRGLTVNLRYVGGGQGIQQLISGDLDIFHTNPDQPALAIDKGAGIKGLIGTINTPFSLLGAPGINSIADLRGKNIGTGAIASSDATLISAILSANGLNKGDYQILQSGSGANKIAALASGNVQAVTLTQPQDFQYLEAQPQAKRLAFSSDVLDFQSIAGFYNVAWGSENQETLRNFTEAAFEAKDFITDPGNRDEVIASLSKASNISTEIASKVYDLYTEKGLFATALDVNVEKLNRYFDLSASAGMGQFKDASEYFDMSYVAKP